VKTGRRRAGSIDAMTFDHDGFISYTHIDNRPLAKDRNGWITDLHQALTTRLTMLLGTEARLWIDPKLDGNDYFGDVLIARLQRVAALISVISPGYVRSEWCLKEFAEFCRAAEKQGGLRVGDKARLFKVLKTPIPLEDHPRELQGLLGYEFYRHEDGRPFEAIFGADAERDFWFKLDDLARDMRDLLKLLEASRHGDQTPPPEREPIYLAVTTGDLKNQRDALKRDLEQHGYRVVPDRVLPMGFAELQAAIREDLAACRLSIHMFGATYSFVPEGAEASILELQNDLAIERAGRGSFSRLIWLPDRLQVADPRQKAVVDHLRLDQRVPAGADLLEKSFEDLRTIIADKLKDLKKPEAEAAPAPAALGARQLYLLYDRRDASVVVPWATFLCKDFEVIRPVFDGDEAELREYHEDNLRNCDGVLIFYGSANEFWLRRKLKEVQKSAGYGRTKPAPVLAICLIPPKTPEKEGFSTHEGLVIPQWDGLVADALEPFAARLRSGGQARLGNDVSAL
jgi:hypothetical protein